MLSDRDAAETLVYRFGPMDGGRFWLERPDGRIFQLNKDALAVVRRLSSGISPEQICAEAEIDAAELEGLLGHLGIVEGLDWALESDEAGGTGMTSAERAVADRETRGADAAEFSEHEEAGSRTAERQGHETSGAGASERACCEVSEAGALDRTVRETSGAEAEGRMVRETTSSGTFGIPDWGDRRSAAGAPAGCDAIDSAPALLCPWLTSRAYPVVAVLLAVVSAALIAGFVSRVPPAFVTGLIDQWLVAAALTIAVVLHELGHLMAMPRGGGISVSVTWSGPLPMFSIVCNGAWKLARRHRLRIDLGGFIVDIALLGAVAAAALMDDRLGPWAWSFMVVQGFRTLFAVWPLLPGDGYWLLVDLFSVPNLWQRALDALKQRRIGWLSLYALLRMVFMALLWCLYAYMIGLWVMVMLARTPSSALAYLLYPAPLLILLNVLGQLYGGVSALRELRIRKKRPEGRIGEQPLSAAGSSGAGASR